MDAVTALAAGVALSIAAGPVPGVHVEWNKGSGPAQMRVGVPNPPGWYQAAVGPKTADKVVYLTFDDGPAPATPRLLTALAKYDAKATFFVNGGAASRAPWVIKRMHKQGHAVGNHTATHARLTQTSTSKVRWELRQTQQAIGARIAAPCMRPPYGLINARVAKASIAAGFQPVLWTAHIEDWSPHSYAWTVETLKNDTKPGAVILMHDTHSQTVSAVQAVLPWWKKRGYRLETVPVCR